MGCASSAPSSFGTEAEEERLTSEEVKMTHEPTRTTATPDSDNLSDSYKAACASDEAVFYLIWRPVDSDSPMNLACGAKGFIVTDTDAMLHAPNDTSAADYWLTEDVVAGIKAALLKSVAALISPAPPATIASVEKSLAFNHAARAKFKDVLGEQAPEGIAVLARAKALDTLTDKKAEAWRYTAKGAVRRVLPCGEVDVEEVWKTTKFIGGDRHILGEVQRAYPVGSKVGKRDGAGGANTRDLCLWAGVKVTVRPGSTPHQAVHVSCIKPAKDAKFGVAFEGPEGKVAKPPLGQIAVVHSKAAARLPTVVTLGSLLEASGLEKGDEIMWVNDIECLGPVSQCVEALVGAEAGDLRIIARRGS